LDSIKKISFDKAVFSSAIGTRRIKSSTRNNKTNLPVYAIDVNSKFEIEPGLKKINDVRILCNCPNKTKKKQMSYHVNEKRLLW
jgi:phosphoribosylanthranilate isomerase